MKYEQQIGVPFEVPLNTPLWATDYLINDDNLVARLKCQPILGEVISIERFSKEDDVWIWRFHGALGANVGLDEHIDKGLYHPIGMDFLVIAII